ncbi:DNA replication and repair protein RecF [Pseudovibrio axinellae]|uniref:DNA replication and repair protein RecF n=1 Tax=Pseudovibrio axinellae TaxID=989403 RepID=A0A165Z535_9HYPH|nr:DNA replication/repair protein RecF [Pseudovibrio axinellae]KZL19517.1 DNA replication and repair protein RecF [Pseudovibrio axinellae]SEQ30128.1 DNA replication and repair protein RecF [Pseudovibrio axinellae]
MSDPVPVALSRLALTDFRNYSAASVELGSRMVAFVGNNGAGKTNILEAISFLSAGRGLRRVTLGDIARADGAGGWAVSTVLDGEYGETRIGTGLTAGEAGRRVRIDGEEARSSEALLEYLRVLWLVPSMDGLFTGSASDRRKFLDRLVLSLNPSHGRSVASFEKALRQRNRLLSDGGTPEFLDAIEAQVAELGTAVALARSETVSLLSKTLDNQKQLGLPFPTAEIHLQGAFEAATIGLCASDREDCYRALLVEGRFRDRAAGRTLDGPHRSDLYVVHCEKQMPASQASTGEQKALLIGLVLAHADLTASISGMTPILLLDEVAAHLDPGRREALFTRLEALGGQVFMTGTDQTLFKDLPSGAQIFEVANGTISLC